MLNEGQWRGKVFSGEWRTASGGVVDVQEPATLERLSQTGLANAADVAAAAKTAAQAQPLWAAMPYEARADVFRKAAAGTRLRMLGRYQGDDYILAEIVPVAPAESATPAGTPRPR